MSSCTISGNTSISNGGGISSFLGGGTINKCVITNNTAQSWGGGIYSWGSTLSLTNCEIATNTSDMGGGVYLRNSSPTIINCTISSNVAGTNGGGIYCYGSIDFPSKPLITNSILWGDTPEEIFLYNLHSDPAVTYSDIQHGYLGLGNIDSDPLFTRSGVYQFTASSPCINSGTSTGAPSTDIDGTPRPQGAGYDMGAYEFFLASSAPTSITGSATKITATSATLNGTLNPNGGSSWYYFEYGTTTSYGSTTESATAGAGKTLVSVGADITGLEPSSTYHYRLVGANNAGTNSGGDRTFTTSGGTTTTTTTTTTSTTTTTTSTTTTTTIPPVVPTVTTGSATPITSESATLKGKVNPNGSITEAHFEYGTTTSYGSTSSSEDIGAGTSSVTVSATISGLISDTTYHYRLAATNIEGTSSGTDMTFYTAVIYVSSNGTCGGNNPCYSTIQEAIDAASSGTTIHISEGSYDEDVTLYAAKMIILQGGWNSTFTTQSSYTTVKGSMVIGDGNVKLRNIKIYFQK